MTNTSARVFDASLEADENALLRSSGTLIPDGADMIAISGYRWCLDARRGVEGAIEQGQGQTSVEVSMTSLPVPRSIYSSPTFGLPFDIPLYIFQPEISLL